MQVSDVPHVLQEHLGHQATIGLLTLFTSARQEWTTEVTTAAVERFERRLSEELSEVRQEFRASLAELRQEFKADLNGLRQEFHQDITNLRQELRQDITNLHHELCRDMSHLHQELHRDVSNLHREQMTSRFPLVKWCFVFWVGQALATAGMVGVMLRFVQL